MKTYFIDAKNEFIIDVDVRDYPHKKELIECDYLELYPHQVNGNDIWTDEEANLKEYNYFFQIDDVIVSGNAIIMSCDEHGESIPPKDLTVEELKSRVTFMGKRYIDPSKLKFEVREWN
jgi:hypothetical protein